MVMFNKMVSKIASRMLFNSWVEAVLLQQWIESWKQSEVWGR